MRSIYEAKGRPSTSPLIVHIADLEMLPRVAAEWPESAQKLAERFWPGPLTLILRKRPEVPALVTGGLDTVGVRIPAHPVALELIRLSGVPVAAPSANRFMGISPTTAEHVRLGLGDRVDFILDAGPCKVGIESTVLSLAGGHSILLRPGMISRRQIEEVIGPIDLAPQPACRRRSRVTRSSSAALRAENAVVSAQCRGITARRAWKAAELFQRAGVLCGASLFGVARR